MAKEKSYKDRKGMSPKEGRSQGYLPDDRDGFHDFPTSDHVDLGAGDEVERAINGATPNEKEFCDNTDDKE